MRMSCCYCCQKDLARGGITTAIYASNQYGLRSTSTMPSASRRVQPRLNYCPRPPPCIHIHQVSQQTNCACTLFSKTHQPCWARSSMWPITALAVLSNAFPPLELCRSPTAITLLSRRWHCWIMTIMLIGWLFHVKTANTSKSRHQSRPMHALGTCSPQNLGLTLLVVDACSSCFSGTPPLVPLIIGGPRTRPGGPPA
jgi:hypothetical protein